MSSPAVAAADVEACLARVLDSAAFRGAERSRHLLRFIVEETLAGRAGRLKDYTLGAEALGRGDGFDPRIDPIARVEASRLRGRLDLYYASEGAGDPVRIVVPKGGYAAVFEPRPVAPAATRHRFDAAAAVPIAAAAVLAAATTWWLMRSPQPASRPETRVELTTPPTTDPGSLALSPDGRSIVLVSTDGGVSRLCLRRLAESVCRPLPGTEYASLPFWSPDGRAIGFFADARVKTIDVATLVVRSRSTALVPAGAAWGRGGDILHPLVPDSPLVRVRADGAIGPASTLAPGQTGHLGPCFLPDGQHFLFYATGTAGARGIYLGELGSLAARRLLDADGPAVVAPPRHVLYVQNATLFAHAIDVASAALVGEPRRVVEGVAVDAGSGLLPISAAAIGAVAYRTGAAAAQRQFVWFDRQGHELSRIGEPEARGPAYGSLSPDGRRLAIQRTSAGNTDIWLVDLERGPSVRFTSEQQADIAPAWSPRGDRIAYASKVEGVFELVERRLDRPESRLLLRTGQAKQITDWSRDGSRLLYRAVTASPRPDMDVWTVALDGRQTPQPVVRTPFEERDAQFSPDGRWIAYQSNETGGPEIYVQPSTGPGERMRISPAGGVQARWRSDGRELFYLTPDGRLHAVPMTTAAGGGPMRVGPPAPLFQTRSGETQGVSLPSYVVAPDGERFLVDVVIEQRPAPIGLVLDWRP